MAKVAAVVLAVILIATFSLAVAGRVGKGETIYTVPQVQDSLKALRGRTVLVRGTLGFPVRFGWSPTWRCLGPCRSTYGLLGEPVHHGLVEYTPSIYVLAGPQDPILATLRRARLLPPFPALTSMPRVYRVRILIHTPAYCVRTPVCPSAVLLDTLR
jgi:hypothetical protein